MRKSLLVLLIAIFLPSLLLGWLALRGAEEQQIVIEKRTAELYQAETDSVATAARVLLDEERKSFESAVQDLLSKGTAGADAAAARFPAELPKAWKRRAIGFVAHEDGRLISPTTRDAASRPDWQQFLWDNGAFLGNKQVATVYPVAVDDLSRPEAMRKGNYLQQKGLPSRGGSPAPSEKEEYVQKKSAEAGTKQVPGAPEGMLVLRDNTGAPAAWDNSARSVAPQQLAPDAAPVSQLAWATASFRDLVVGERAGMLNRFVQDRLMMIFWVRPESANKLIFGCLIEVNDLADLWPAAVKVPSSERVRGRSGASYSYEDGPEFMVTLLNDRGQPAVPLPAGARAPDWRRPFVASEVGEALPHWEAALYLKNPAQLSESARRVRRLLYSLITVALLAIGAGALVVISDTRRQLVLAQKKTDFVSNVSHELKTPLTSIRMFAELMDGGTVAPEKRAQYTRIILLESERLTRLIDNVLDFARIERRQKRLNLRDVDLYPVIARVWEGQELHLRDEGFAMRWDSAPGPYLTRADSDAVAQIVVNLVGNAQKYSGSAREITMHSFIDGNWLNVAVLDRGTGVPAGQEQKIFEAFYRAHDSLASGIQGSGLGLTLAQRLAREQGGDLIYERREGGGSRFTLRLPLIGSKTEERS